MLEGDGYCYMDVRLKTGEEVGLLSLQRLAFGLLYVVDDCVSHASTPRGGWVFNMGEYFSRFRIDDGKMEVRSDAWWYCRWGRQCLCSCPGECAGSAV